MQKEYVGKRLYDINEDLVSVTDSFISSYFCLLNTFKNGNKVFVCGNGGSSSDAEHIVAELVKDYMKARPINEPFMKKLTEFFGSDGAEMAKKLQGGLPAISLTCPSSVITAISNDIDYSLVFAQQLVALGKNGDCLLLLSTSGNSENVIQAAKVAKAMEIKTIAFTGLNQGQLDNICDIVIKIPSTMTPAIQESHKAISHLLCELLEEELFKTEDVLVC
ncbi:phosphoheptose isomerase [Bacillus pseudomycoides]|uniref:D-sedoheptulose-7-phosphate isomerase n=1 Tax=Bacillus pseudomycoides TaxID=64104 RepID=UPI000BF06A04|nr:SIS domain-containing protein [Bacillus pseudomycoides]PEK39644.1 phosphoheptose isomerase [Bacillus pseudomycoides]PEK66393.1 phosphoheptose isomerase [Bacillus pseudomycoides]PEP38737.1 phosphoheptose isomerase [Bacillus pseudomycoides]PEP40658.1 phosphoheptose isomerase [Bacillus pseudomycoides]PFX44320.1 phosphoheptose isomerase [Bacillus pseudomycoides]